MVINTIVGTLNGLFTMFIHCFEFPILKTQKVNKHGIHLVLSSNDIVT